MLKRINPTLNKISPAKNKTANIISQLLTELKNYPVKNTILSDISIKRLVSFVIFFMFISFNLSV